MGLGGLSDRGWLEWLEGLRPDLLDGAVELEGWRAGGLEGSGSWRDRKSVV